DPIAKARRPRSVPSPSPARAGTKSPPRDGDSSDYAGGFSAAALVTLIFLQGVERVGVLCSICGDRGGWIPLNHPRPWEREGPAATHRIRYAIIAVFPRCAVSRQLTTAPTGAPTTGSSWASLARSMW